jgi:hypothetical protein|tara:strand:+ start:3221 stop:3343 length:123 start_codon:yes stop_codon:yes gene_type:complete
MSSFVVVTLRKGLEQRYMAALIKETGGLEMDCLGKGHFSM